MSWVIGILLVLAGVIIGFFVARQFPVILQDSKLKEELQKIKLESQDYQTDVDIYVNDVQHNINKLESQLAEVKQRLAQHPQRNSQVLDQLTGGASPFFDNAAFAHLRATKHVDTRHNETTSAPPLDYSSQSSGLFVGKEDEPKTELKNKFEKPSA